MNRVRVNDKRIQVVSSSTSQSETDSGRVRIVSSGAQPLESRTETISVTNKIRRLNSVSLGNDMEQRAAALKQIIRKSDSTNNRSSRLGEKDYYLWSGVVSKKRPLIGIGVKRYVLATGNRISYGGKTVRVKSDTVLDALNVMLTFQLECPAGHEERFVKSVGGDRDPAVALEEIIDQAVEACQREVVVRGREPNADLLEHASAWEAFISEHLMRATGLFVSTSLMVAENPLDSVIFKETVNVYVEDCSDDVSVDAEISLEVDQSAKARALSGRHRADRLRDAVRDTIRRIISERYGIHAVCTQPERIEEDLRRGVAATVAQDGRHIGAFKICIRTGFSLPSLDIIDHRHSCKVKNRDERVEIQHHVLLELQDTAKWRRSSVRDVITWIQERIDHITQTELFELDYVTVVSTFDADIKPRIRSRLQAETTQIGFQVKQLSSVTNDELTRIQLNGFRTAIEEEFATRDSRVKVKLNIVVKGRIEQLHKLEKYVSVGTDLIKDEIDPEIRNAAADVLHETSPEQFYLHFETNSDTEHGESVATQVSTAAVTRLKQRYGADCKVTVKQVDTWLTDRFKALCRSRGDFVVTALPNDGTPVDFKVSFRVTCIAPGYWHVFQEGGIDKDGKPDVVAEMTDIRNFIEQKVSQKLRNTLPKRALEYQTESHRHRIELAVFERGEFGVIDDVIRHYGLVVAITGFMRDDSSQVKAIRHDTQASLEHQLKLREAERQHDLNRIQLLQGKENELLAGDVEDPELEDLRNAIGAIRSQDDADGINQHSIRSYRLTLPQAEDSEEVDDMQSFLLPTNDQSVRRISKKSDASSPSDREEGVG